MVCGGCSNHRHHYLGRVFVATALDISMTYFTKQCILKHYYILHKHITLKKQNNRIKI